MSWNQQQLKAIIQFISNRLLRQANVTFFNIVFNIAVEERLIILFGNEFLSFLNSEKIYLWIIMMPGNWLGFNDFRNIEKALKLKNLIRFFLSFELIGPDFLSLVIFFLRFLKLQFYDTNTDFVGTFANKFTLKCVLKMM